MSDKIKPHHVARKAILYVRQSSPHQVLHNEESRRLQYAMRDRLRSLGWTEIEVIDEDLGRSAAGTVPRHGFERMVAEVCLGQVGAVSAREVSRFARNSRDWQQLVEVCRLVDTLLVDHDVVYAPRQGNDRLLLGLKGSLNEYELDLLRQRSVDARYEKARRGELVVSTPIGFVRADDQRLELDPDVRVRDRIRLVYSKFAEVGSVRQVLLWFLEHDVDLPARSPRGATRWIRARYANVYNFLTHPVYAGAYTFGRTEHGTLVDGGRVRRVSRRRPRASWIALLPGRHEGYVAWDEFQRIQAIISENNNRDDGSGAVKKGSALLAGLVHCRRCGRKVVVAYTGRTREFPRYQCHRGYLDTGEPKCIGFGGRPVDQAVGRELLRVVEPASVDAAAAAERESEQVRDAARTALELDLTAARYEAGRAERQFTAADPENRLVTAELERRWNRTLDRVRELETRLAESSTAPPPTPFEPGELSALAIDLDDVWNDPRADVRVKKRIVRTLIRDVFVDLDSATREVVLVVHWQGGTHTELRLPHRGRGSATRTATDVIAAVRVLARVSSDDVIAGILNRNRFPTGRGNRWTRERVQSLRVYHRLLRTDSEGEWLTLTDAAALLGVSSRTLRIAAERGEVVGEHPLPLGPWVFARSSLQTVAAARVVARACGRTGRPAVPNAAQKIFEFPEYGTKEQCADE